MSNLCFFQSYCASTYCSYLWVNYTQQLYHKLKVAYNNTVRRLLGYYRRDSASYMFASNSIDSFAVLYRKGMYILGNVY